MAPKTAALTILLLLVVSFIFADRVKCQQVDESQRQELVRDDESYGPCVEVLCAAACLLQMNRGGHCKGGFFGACMCFVCS
ncbi:hypothetical protein PVAP13_7NG118517 [Panicum virgatum]|uniref:Uncharacterized protein n=1 Tax=Panicum virgatum TaxID=38727 RepID=A0A8T0Q5R6_PANVG|nr:hypothetical protein PVAP13_7NG118517 [Panicum virgatum]